MKTSKITITLATLNLVLFMSVSSFAKPFTSYEGDIIKSGVKKQIEAVKSTISGITSNVSSENDFSHLRFEVSKFNTESKIVELPLNTMDYLYFDANDFNLTTDLTEMPVDDFGFIRFNINSFNYASEISEMPVDDFHYLRFDVNKYSDETSVDIDELPAN